MNLELSEIARARLKKFHEDGLVYLVNTSVLHPRGIALAIHIDDDGEPVGLSVVGDGDEPWCFGKETTAEEVERYHAAERAREEDWSNRLSS